MTEPTNEDAKAKFLKALEKKKKGQGIRNNNIADGTRISGGEVSGKTPKMFRRKSGSA
jgi:Family of unknown function (DUF5302)